MPGRALIFAPIIMEGKQDSHIDCMFEIRMHVMLTLQQAAEEAGVGYRSIQRWRDEHGLPVFKYGNRQMIILGILRDFAEEKGVRRRTHRCSNCKNRIADSWIKVDD